MPPAPAQISSMRGGWSMAVAMVIAIASNTQDITQRVGCMRLDNTEVRKVIVNKILWDGDFGDECHGPASGMIAVLKMPRCLLGL